MVLSDVMEGDLNKARLGCDRAHALELQGLTGISGLAPERRRFLLPGTGTPLRRRSRMPRSIPRRQAGGVDRRAVRGGVARRLVVLLAEGVRILRLGGMQVDDGSLNARRRVLQTNQHDEDGPQMHGAQTEVRDG